MINEFKVLPLKVEPVLETLYTYKLRPLKYAVVYNNDVMGVFVNEYLANQYIANGPHDNFWSVREIFVNEIKVEFCS